MPELISFEKLTHVGRTKYHLILYLPLYKLIIRISVQVHMIRFSGVTLHMMRHNQHEQIEVSFPEFAPFGANRLLNKSAR